MYQLFNPYVVGLIIIWFRFNVAQNGEIGGISCSEFEICMDIGKCHTHFKRSSDVAASSCGRGKVFCRKKSKWKTDEQIFGRQNVYFFLQEIHVRCFIKGDYFTLVMMENVTFP